MLPLTFDINKVVQDIARGTHTLSYVQSIAAPDSTQSEPKFSPKDFTGRPHNYKFFENKTGAFIETTDPSLKANKGDEESQNLRNKILESCGLDPEQCRIVGRVSVSNSRWTSGENTNKAQRYRYQIEFVNPEVDDLNERLNFVAENRVVETLKRHRKAEDRRAAESTSGKPPKGIKVGKGNRVANLILADAQLGKADGYGTQGIVDLFGEVVAQFAKKVLVEKPDAVAVFMPGDCIEGNQSQGGRNMGFNTELTITEQNRVLGRVMDSIVRTIAPLVPEFHLTVVNGNHDQAQRAPINTKAGDGWATEQAIALQYNLDQAKKFDSVNTYNHVQIHYPAPNRHYVTVQVKDSIYLVSHGHTWPRGKAEQWMKTHCYNMGPGAMAQFLIHGHEHTASFLSRPPRTLICAPAMDGGSDWLDGSMPGLVQLSGGSYFVSDGANWRDYTIFQTEVDGQAAN